MNGTKNKRLIYKAFAFVSCLLITGCSETKGTLKISTVPGNAQISIDQKVLGNTGATRSEYLQIILKEGKYSIHALLPRNEGEEYYGEIEVLVTGGVEQFVNIDLQYRPTAVAGKIIENQGYVIGTDGQTVFDKNTNLTWMRCSLGQVWRGNSCAGEAKKYNLYEASDMETGLPAASGTGWRIPTKEELLSLVFCSSGKRDEINYKGVGGGCIGNYDNPTIFNLAFPNTPSDKFYASTPLIEKVPADLRGKNVIVDGKIVYRNRVTGWELGYVNFENGSFEKQADDGLDKLLIRKVRVGQ